MKIVEEMITFHELVFTLEKANGLINQFIGLTRIIGMFDDTDSQKIVFDYRNKIKNEVVEANDNFIKMIEVFHYKNKSDYQDYLVNIKAEMERIMNLDVKTNIDFKEAGKLEKEIDIFKSYIEQFHIFLIPIINRKTILDNELNRVVKEIG